MGFVNSFDQATSSKVDESKKKTNPGTFEDLFAACKSVLPINFEGAKATINKDLNQCFRVTHSLNLTSQNNSGYKFGGTYIGPNQFGLNESYPVLIGELDTSGNLSARAIHKFNDHVMCQYFAEVQDSKVAASQLITHYRGSDYTLSAVLVNTDIVNCSGVTLTQYLQSVTPSLAVGAELLYQYGPSIPGRQIAAVSLAAKYTRSDYFLSLVLGAMGIHAGYWRKCSEQVQFGCEIESNLMMMESVGTVGYRIEVPKANFVFRGSFDSNWTAAAVLEKSLQPLPFTFSISGTLNHVKNQFRFGCGLIIG